jgi:hypothetical protein
MTLVPDFIKQITTSVSKEVVVASGRAQKSFQTALASVVVDSGANDQGAGKVVLAFLTKGVLSTDDTFKAPTLLLGSTANVLVELSEPLAIGVGGGGQVVQVEVEDVPRFTRFTTNARWG